MASRRSINTTMLAIIFKTLLIVLCFANTTFCVTFDAVVAQDGSGDFGTVSEAISGVPRNSKTRYNIRVKPGRYRERVEIKSDMTYVTMIGDDPSTTIIVFDRSNKTHFLTSETGTFNVYGEGFVAESLTFENSAGPNMGQAVALYNDADKTAFYRCNILGYQDTLYAGSNHRQFYKECNISGTVDFIFGAAKAVFQDCRLLARRAGENVVTAQSRETADQESGFVFQGCTVAASPEASGGAVVAFLGRPWRIFSRVVFMQSLLEDVVAPAGWLRWNAADPVDRLYYGEYENRGTGAGTSQRVDWKGFHVLTDFREAAFFTVNNFIGGNAWLPQTGVPFRGDLNKPMALADI